MTVVGLLLWALMASAQSFEMGLAAQVPPALGPSFTARPQLRHTFSHQTLSELKLTSYTVPRGYALYWGQSCSDMAVEIRGSDILWYAQGFVAVQDPARFDDLMLSSRRKSKWYRALMVAQYAAAAATLYLASTTVPVAAKVAPAAVAFLGGEAAKALAPVNIAPSSTMHLWRPDDRIAIPAGGCASGYVGARWDGKTQAF